MNYDAEQFNIQPAIDTLVLDSMRRFNRTSAAVLHTYQCYLKVTNSLCCYTTLGSVDVHYIARD